MFPSGSLFYADRDETIWTEHVRMAYSRASIDRITEATVRLKSTFLRIVD